MDIERSDQTGSFKSTEPSSPVSYPQAGWHSALYGFRERERQRQGTRKGGREKKMSLRKRETMARDENKERNREG